ncbi:glutamate racemase [Gemmatimonas sp.]|uniref:glutamate racemase n=1 Tax=Gemmatimonas sp. TaxID=1962908 RepID=UPI00286CA4C0|nr:glutamate racemase [Gemmatimonas sp.]
MMQASRGASIGMFDSGLGGLTVANALMRRLPAESLLYFGDTARVPYGPKSPDTVRRYALQIGEWLVQEGVKCVVVACNTATAHALDALQSTLSVPVIGVVEPGARAAVRASRGGPIGVIGTSGTIASGAYTRAIHRQSPDIDVRAEACPLFVPLVEEGWIDHLATRLIAHDYLAPMREARVDTLVLGCTHYPLLAPVIAAEMGPEVRLIDSAEETAAEVERILAERGLLQDTSGEHGREPTHRFVASDAPQHFLALGGRFLDVPLTAVEYHVFT